MKRTKQKAERQDSQRQLIRTQIMQSISAPSRYVIDASGFWLDRYEPRGRQIRRREAQ